MENALELVTAVLPLEVALLSLITALVTLFVVIMAVKRKRKWLSKGGNFKDPLGYIGFLFVIHISHYAIKSASKSKRFL